MKIIKIAKKISFYININYSYENGFTKQNFEFITTNKKYLRYAYDKRYLLKKKIESIVNDNLLDDLTFKSRDDTEDKIIISYNGEMRKTIPSKIINCEFYLPPFNGCQYCTKGKKEKDFLYCKEKDKHYDFNGIKNCPVFESINEILS